MMTCIRNVASSRQFIFAVVELYVELSGRMSGNWSQYIASSESLALKSIPANNRNSRAISFVASRPNSITDLHSLSSGVGQFFSGLLSHIGATQNAFVELQVLSIS